VIENNGEEGQPCCRKALSGLQIAHIRAAGISRCITPRKEKKETGKNEDGNHREGGPKKFCKGENIKRQG